jgi:hypothetical protein
MPERVQPGFGNPQPFEQRMEHTLAEVAVGEGRLRAALEEPVGFSLSDEELKHLDERLIDVDLSDRVLRLRSRVLSFPNASADVNLTCPQNPLRG